MYYYNNKIKFEGEYLNGLKWNGKGFDNNNIIIYELNNGKGHVIEHDNDGKLKLEYLNGRKNGKGKEYNQKGKLIFEGVYLNDLRNGECTEYNYNGELKFVGEYLYGNKLKGKYYIKGKLEYEGEYLYNKKWNGKGYNENGNIIYKLGNGNGRIKEYNEDGILIFEWKKEWKRKTI